jgi:hypothetical protein
VILSTQQIADVINGKLNEVRYPIDEPPIWGDGDIVQIKNGDRRRRGTGRYVEITAWDIVTTPEGEEYALWFRPCNSPHETRGLTHAGRPKGSEKGYTKVGAHMMKGEGEALTESEQQERSKQGREDFFHHRLRTAKEEKEYLKTLSPQERVDLAVKAAEKNNVDVRSNRRSVQRFIDNKAHLSAVLQHLQVLERRAYKWPK